MGTAWDRVWEVFHAAREVPVSQRDAWLREALAQEPELLGEVQTLLDADGQDSMLDRSPFVSEQVEVPERIGPYRITELIGVGGMGKVFLGKRDDDVFEQQVAIKLADNVTADESWLQRFDSERRILASLNHPNIARLYDGGTSEHGLPYLIMEYVDGVRITEHCESKRLNLDQVLELFIALCDAVQHAHQKLVIHRDIKPANVMVTQGGDPKLLDFGIAKLTNQRKVTQATERFGPAVTPEYASPEQIDGQALTTATDVYSLGALLYRLLTGTVPLELSQDGLLAHLERLRDTTPQLPSDAIRSDHYLNRLERNLRRRLRGDLDRIVMMALRKEPERRYASAAAMAVDIQRAQAALPVSARPDSIRYRISRFIARHPFGSVAAVASMVLISGFAIYSQHQANALSDALHDAELARQRAQSTADFLVGIFRDADPSVTEQRDITARELLHLGEARMQRELVDQPELRLNLMGTLGQVYANISEYDSALPLLQAAVQERKQSGQLEKADLLELELALAQVMFDLEQFDQAQSQVEALIPRMRSASEIPPDLLVRAIALRVAILGAQGNSAAALEAAEVLLAEEMARYGTQHPATADAHIVLGQQFYRAGEYARATDHLRAALRIHEKTFGAGALATGKAYRKLGDAQLRLGDFVAAEASYLASLDIFSEVFGRKHKLVAQNLYALSGLYAEKGAYEQAQTTGLESAQLFAAIYGTDNAEYAKALNNVALALQQTGALEEAAAHYHTIATIYERVFGPAHWNVAVVRNNLGLVLRDQDQWDAAATEFSRALEILEAAYGAEHPNLAYALTNLGGVRHIQGDFESAESHFARAANIRRNHLPPDHPTIATTLSDWARLRLDQGRVDDARSMLSQAVATRQDKFGLADWRTAESQLLHFAAQTAPEPITEDVEEALGNFLCYFDARHWRTRILQRLLTQRGRWQAVADTWIQSQSSCTNKVGRGTPG